MLGTVTTLKRKRKQRALQTTDLEAMPTDKNELMTKSLYECYLPDDDLTSFCCLF